MGRLQILDPLHKIFEFGAKQTIAFRDLRVKKPHLLVAGRPDTETHWVVGEVVRIKTEDSYAPAKFEPVKLSRVLLLKSRVRHGPDIGHYRTRGTIVGPIDIGLAPPEGHLMRNGAGLAQAK